MVGASEGRTYKDQMRKRCHMCSISRLGGPHQKRVKSPLQYSLAMDAFPVWARINLARIVRLRLLFVGVNWG